MGETLKPCPFCGGEATFAKTARAWKVECEDRMGSCTMNARTHYQPHKHMAVRAWNTRSGDLIPRDEIKREAREEALRDMLGLTINHAPERDDIHNAITALIEKEGV